MPLDWATLGVDLHLELDPAAGRRAGLEHALRDAIRSGRLAAQTRLPSTRALAQELGLARNTVGAAYEQLVAEGYLATRTGSGTFVLGVPRRPAPPASTHQHSSPRFDLRPGSPDVTSFPTQVWLRALRYALGRAPACAYDYGDPRGRPELRTALAEYLGRARGVLAEPDLIVITSGYVQALAISWWSGSAGGTASPASLPAHALVSIDADERRVLDRAAEQGLALGALGPHWHTPSRSRPQGLIIGYATPGRSSYPAALDTLARVLRAA